MTRNERDTHERGDDTPTPAEVSTKRRDAGDGFDAGNETDAHSATLLTDGGRPEDGLDAILDAVDVGIVVAEDRGDITRMNDRAAGLLDVDPASDATVWAAVPGVDEAAFDGALASDGSDAKPIQAVHERPDGTEIPLAVTVTATTAEDGRRVVLTVADVRERNAAIEELQRQDERLEQFASVVSHDLRNPLNVAMGRVQLVQEECDSDHVEPIDDALVRMESLIGDVLALAREGSQPEETEPVPLAEAARRAWATNQGDVSALEIEDGLGSIVAEEDRIGVIFTNLFDNALTFGGEDVTVRLGRHDGGFFVADDGPGISTENREEVFACGYSGDGETNGFGLTIVRDAARALGWSIELAESQDGGARFEFHDVEWA